MYVAHILFVLYNADLEQFYEDHKQVWSFYYSFYKTKLFLGNHNDTKKKQKSFYIYSLGYPW